MIWSTVWRDFCGTKKNSDSWFDFFFYVPNDSATYVEDFGIPFFANRQFFRVQIPKLIISSRYISIFEIFWRYISFLEIYSWLYLHFGDIKRYIFTFWGYISLFQKIYITKMQIYLRFSEDLYLHSLEIYLLFWRFISICAQRYIFNHEKWTFFRKDISPKFKI